MLKSYHVKRGFTLIEILVVVITISLLIGLLLPAIQQAREQARRAHCQNNLMQIGVALHTYQSVHSVLPPGCVNPTGPVKEGGSVFRDLMDLSGIDSSALDGQNGSSKKPVDYGYRMSWIAQILPQLGAENTYRHVDFQNPERSFLTSKQLQYYEQESRSGAGTSSAASGVPADGKPARQTPAGPAVADDYDEQLTPESATPADDEYEDYELGLGDEESDRPTPAPVVIPVLTCTSSWPSAQSDYAGCHASTTVPIDVDNDGLLYLNSSESLYEIPDGAATTILVGEKAMLAGDAGLLVGDCSTLRNTGVTTNTEYPGKSGLAGPNQTQFVAGARGFSSQHSQVCNFLMADGAVRTIADSIALEVLQRLGSRNDGNLVSEFDF